MNWGILPGGQARQSAPFLVYSFIGGLFGYYFQIHNVFLDATSDGIPLRTGKGLLLGAALGLITYSLVRVFLSAFLSRVLKKSIVGLSHVAMFAGIFYASYILFRNTEFLFRYDGVLTDILLVYPLFLALTLLLTLALKFTNRGSFATASLLVFLLFASYIAVRTGSVAGICITLFYYLYLILLGRFAAGGLSRLMGLPLGNALETLLVSFVSGILCNYILWYAIGQMYLLYSLTAYCVIACISAAGFWRYGRSIIARAGEFTVLANGILNNRPSRTTAALLNVTLFGLLLLVAVLSIKFPGNADSSARMYCATVFKFAEIHGIALLPFYQHWPLIFQPLLVEISGLPLYLAGGISAVRFFHGSIYFSFIPFLVLFCRKYSFSHRTIVIFVLIIVSSSFSFCLAYFDKPSVLAFPAFISLLVVCLIMLKDLNPWYVILTGGLLAIIYNSKIILIPGALAAIAMLCIYLIVNRSQVQGGRYKRAVLLSAGIFVVVCSLHFVQNIWLRGNPVHPFAADVFTKSQDFPEELRFANVPANFYQKSIPIAKPSHISTINVDKTQGMYQPFIYNSPDRGGRGYGITKTSVTIVFTLVAVLLPFILLIRPDRVMVFCGILAIISYFVWFGWIGDGWRYSTFFPCVALLSAVLVSKRFLANRYLDLAWRYLFYSLLVLSIPVGFYFTAGLPTTGHMFNYLTYQADKHESLDPVDHVVTTHLRKQSDAKPVLLVADMEVSQYGFFQPNFLYQPISWRKNLFTNIGYLAVIKPTHFLTAKPLDESILIKHYPFLKEHLEKELDTYVVRQRYVLYRFDKVVPWENYCQEYQKDEVVIPGHIEDIQRVLDRYR